MESVREYSLYIIGVLVVLVVVLLVVVFVLAGDSDSESFQYPGILSESQTRNIAYDPAFEQMTQYNKKLFEGLEDKYEESKIENPKLLDILYGK